VTECLGVFTALAVASAAAFVASKALLVATQEEARRVEMEEWLRAWDRYWRKSRP